MEGGDILVIQLKELDVLGSLNSPHTFPVVAELLCKKRIEHSGIITHTLPLDDIVKGIEMVGKRLDKLHEGRRDLRLRCVMMKKLIILGGYVHTTEIVEIIERINAVLPQWDLRGYLTPDGSSTGEMRNGYPVLGGPEAIGDYPNACFLPEVEWPVSHPTPWDWQVSVIDPRRSFRVRPDRERMMRYLSAQLHRGQRGPVGAAPLTTTM